MRPHNVISLQLLMFALHVLMLTVYCTCAWLQDVDYLMSTHHKEFTTGGNLGIISSLKATPLFGCSSTTATAFWVEQRERKALAAAVAPGSIERWRARQLSLICHCGPHMPPFLLPSWENAAQLHGQATMT